MKQKPKQDDMFPDLVSPSPKMMFLMSHNLVTKKTSKSRWNCNLASVPKKGTGRTEDDCIIDWCNKNGVKHYSLT